MWFSDRQISYKILFINSVIKNINHTHMNINIKSEKKYHKF